MKSRNQYLVFGQPLINQAEIDEVVDSLKKCWLGTGPKVAWFEELIADYKGVRHAVAVNSCTAGLHLSCIALGLKPGDEVITTPLTFCATINAIVHAGATPVLVDIDASTMNICPEAIAKKITERTRAIIPVHFAGRPCEMDAILQLSVRHDLRVIEDCAHAIETETGGHKAGTLSDLGVLSFYSTKNVTTGEGGMVLTNDSSLAARIKRLALHGLSADAWSRFSDNGFKHYDVVEVGYKYNMMDLQAAIGIHQIQKVDAYWHRRAQIWSFYQNALAALPITRPLDCADGTRHAFHLYTILIDPARCGGRNREDLIEHLHQRKIGSGVHYRSVPEHPYYQQIFGWQPMDYPRAAAIGRTTISLPLSARLTDEDVHDVVEAVQTFFD